MRFKMTGFVFSLLFCLLFSPVCSAQEKGYFEQMGYVFTRGLKNIVSFPWEIPVTIQKHDRDDNGTPRFLRDTAGFFDGAFRAVTRLGSGLWDVPFSLVPGDQNDLSLKPETFF